MPLHAGVDTRGRRLHDLRISVTDRCNFRCVYCMPREVFGPDYKFLARDGRRNGLAALVDRLDLEGEGLGRVRESGALRCFHPPM